MKRILKSWFFIAGWRSEQELVMDLLEMFDDLRRNCSCEVQEDTSVGEGISLLYTYLCTTQVDPRRQRLQAIQPGGWP